MGESQLDQPVIEGPQFRTERPSVAYTGDPLIDSDLNTQGACIVVDPARESTLKIKGASPLGPRSFPNLREDGLKVMHLRAVAREDRGPLGAPVPQEYLVYNEREVAIRKLPRSNDFRDEINTKNDAATRAELEKEGYATVVEDDHGWLIGVKRKEGEMSLVSHKSALTHEVTDPRYKRTT